jgi:hypothetical protein
VSSSLGIWTHRRSTSVQEALAGIRKHAHPDTITVQTRPSAALHLGLDTLVERIRVTGGSVGITSTKGRGTSVPLTIPSPPTPQPHDDLRSQADHVPRRFELNKAQLEADSGFDRCRP